MEMKERNRDVDGTEIVSHLTSPPCLPVPHLRERNGRERNGDGSETGTEIVLTAGGQADKRPHPWQDERPE